MVKGHGQHPAPHVVAATESLSGLNEPLPTSEDSRSIAQMQDRILSY